MSQPTNVHAYMYFRYTYNIIVNLVGSSLCRCVFFIQVHVHVHVATSTSTTWNCCTCAVCVQSEVAVHAIIGRLWVRNYVCLCACVVMWNVGQLGEERHHGKLSGVAMPLRIIFQVHKEWNVCAYIRVGCVSLWQPLPRSQCPSSCLALLTPWVLFSGTVLQCVSWDDCGCSGFTAIH